MANVPVWVWLGAGWAAIAAGAWLVLTGRVKRLRHGGRRCRKCLYDMKGLGTRTCPECGTVARSEHSLQRRRGRQRLRLAGLLAVVAGWALIKTPSMLADGWPGAVPDVVLALIAPTELEWSQRGQAARFRGRAATPNNWGIGLAPPIKPPAATVTERLQGEIERRLFAGAIWKPAASLYLRRVCAGLAELTPEQLGAPSAWPWDLKMRFRPSQHEGVSLWCEPDAPTGPCQEVGLTVSGLFHQNTYHIARRTLRVDMSRTRLAFMDQVSGAATDRAVGEAVNPVLIIRSNTVLLQVDQRRENAAWKNADFFLCYSVRLLQGERELGEGWSIAWRSPNPPSLTQYVPIKWTDGGRELLLADPESITVELIAEPGGATEHYLQNPGLAPRTAWGGRVRVKPGVQRP